MKQIESSGEKKTATKKRGREEEESKIYLLAVESDTNEKMPAVCVYQLYQASTALPKGFDYIYIIQYEVATAIPSGYGYTKWLQQYQMAMLWLWLHVSSRRNTKVSNLGPFLG